MDSSLLKVSGVSRMEWISVSFAGEVDNLMEITALPPGYGYDGLVKNARDSGPSARAVGRNGNQGAARFEA